MRSPPEDGRPIAPAIARIIDFTPPCAPFTPASLALYDEIRQAQAGALMKGARTDSKGFYS